LWFGATYDFRDFYLELQLGHLYWFRDVMPRVIILGNLSDYGVIYPKIDVGPDRLKSILADIAESFEHALAAYNTAYPAILERHLDPPKGKYRKEYLSCLRTEVQEAELEEYIE